MAEAVGHAPSTIHRMWRAFGLQPHRSETFKLSTDPLFVEKVRDIVGLYLAPPERALVLCVDEKSQIQALDRTRPDDILSSIRRFCLATVKTAELQAEIGKTSESGH